MRSLVPMAKKSLSAASASAASAAPGISIMTPSGGGGSPILMPRRFSRRATCPSASRTARISLDGQIIGSRMRTGPSAPARSMARELGVEEPRSLSDRRMARKPSAGLVPAAAGLGERRGELVAADIERADGDRTTGHAAHQPAIGLELLVLVGQVLAVHVEELAAHQPQPLRAGGQRLVELARQLEIGLQRDLDAIARHRRQAPEPREQALLALQRLLLRLVALDRLAPRD